MSPKLTMHPTPQSEIEPKYKTTRANYLQDAATEAPTGAAEPVTAQSIRRGRCRSLQRVKPNVPEADQASNPNQSQIKPKYKTTRANYRKDSATEAPTGAAEPVTAQSIRRGRCCSLQRVKPNVPEADHASNPNNHKSNQNTKQREQVTSEIQRLKRRQVRQSL